MKNKNKTKSIILQNEINSKTGLTLIKSYNSYSSIKFYLEKDSQKPNIKYVIYMFDEDSKIVKETKDKTMKQSEFQRYVINEFQEQKKFNQYVINEFQEQKKFNQYVIEQFEEQKKFNQYVLEQFEEQKKFNQYVIEKFEEQNKFNKSILDEIKNLKKFHENE